MIGRFIEWLVLRVLSRLWPKRYRLIPRLDGKPMLRQFKITNWCYLQSFLIPETREYFHRHRWQRMISFVLSGYFQEERYPGGQVCFFRDHKAWSVYSMNGSDIHRLHYAAPRTWTLFLMFRDWKHWGYYARPASLEYVSWDRMIKPENRVVKL